MYIKKFMNGNIHLKLEEENGLEEILCSNDLFMADLYIYSSSVDGWLYIYDTNRNLVYWLNGYHFNEIDELLQGKSVILKSHKNDDTYEGYEWNDKEEA